jgi:P4 family phage/plasmid primase-like protien
MLQEWFGYCLTYDTSHHKLLLLHGEGANGKSVICGALEALIGRDNCSNVALEEFGDKFAFGSTLGKLVNISPDSGQLEHEAEGRLKGYTSGNKMSFDRKNLPRIDMVPTARLVVSTNDRPKFRDKSGGVWRRLLLLPMTTVIPEKEKILGMDEIKWWEQSGELPGMLLWALRGLARLKRQKAFTVPLVSAAELEQYRDEQNPARVFLRDYTQASDDAEVKTEELYSGYVAWCESHGHKPVPDTNFGKEVKRFHDVDKQRVRLHGKRTNVYSIEYCPDGCGQMGEL